MIKIVIVLSNYLYINILTFFIYFDNIPILIFDIKYIKLYFIL